MMRTSREAMADATKAVDLTPARVFAENMRFWYDAAANLTRKIEEFLEEISPEMVTQNPHLLEEFNRTLKNMLFAREKAQQCAVDMAPYRHPRLALIDATAKFTDEHEPDVPRITKQMTAKEAAAAYEASLKE